MDTKEVDWVKKCSDLIDQIEKLEPKLNDDENVVCDILVDNLDIIPPDFFKEKTVEELNEHFGGKGKIKVTERVKEYMTLFQEQSLISNCMMEVYDERASKDDDRDMKKLLKENTDIDFEEDDETSGYTDEEIIECCEDLEMCPPEMFDSYDEFRKNLVFVWPNHPPIGPDLFKRIQKKMNK